jgi:Leucine-rich repeat (LRR) protein
LYGRSELDLHSLEVETLPEKVYDLTELNSLLVRHNKLECCTNNLTISVSPRLSQLQALTILDLGWNQLKVVPPPIFELKLLQSLILNNNLIETLDPRIGSLGNTLKTLHLGVNQLTSLPDEVGQLTALNSLIAPSNLITDLPETMVGMVSLDDIYLRGNHLTKLPAVLNKLSRLSIISVEDNRIVVLPDASELPKAQVLHSVPQEVLPNIYIGSASTSKNRRSLALFQLTHHVALTDPIGDSHSPESAVSDHIFQERLLLTISDVEAQSLDEAIRQCNGFLETAVQQGCKVLVNSTLGVSRSAAIICAYMIKNLGVSYEEALARLRTVRGNVKPNSGFERQLLAYEKSFKR